MDVSVWAGNSSGVFLLCVFCLGTTSTGVFAMDFPYGGMRKENRIRKRLSKQDGKERVTQS